MGAGHPKVGDKIKQADGTTGVVANVLTLQQTREVFNLTVDTAHIFYVGTQGWLVHNTGPCFNYSSNIDLTKQDTPVAETPSPIDRVKIDRSTSGCYDKELAEFYTQLALKEGTPIPGQSGVFDLEAGTPVGVGPKGGYQIRIRAHADSKGVAYSLPVEPEHL